MANPKIVDEITIESDDEDICQVDISVLTAPVAKIENGEMNDSKISAPPEPQAISIVDFEGDVDQDLLINSVETSPNFINSMENRFTIEADSEPSSFLPTTIAQLAIPEEQPKKKQRRKKPYWFGTEHGNPVGPSQPLIVLDKLSNSLLQQMYPDFCGDKGHNCKDGKACKWPIRIRGPRPKKPPQPELQPNPSIESTCEYSFRSITLVIHVNNS